MLHFVRKVSKKSESWEELVDSDAGGGDPLVLVLVAFAAGGGGLVVTLGRGVEEVSPTFNFILPGEAEFNLVLEFKDDDDDPDDGNIGGEGDLLLLLEPLLFLPLIGGVGTRILALLDELLSVLLLLLLLLLL